MVAHKPAIKQEPEISIDDDYHCDDLEYAA